VEPQNDKDDDHQTVRRPVSVDSRRPTLTDEGIGAVVGALATLAVLLFVVNITTPLYTQPVQRHLKRTASRRQSTVLSLSEFIELTNIIIHGYNERLL